MYNYPALHFSIRTAVVVSQGFVQNESLGTCLYCSRIEGDRLVILIEKSFESHSSYRLVLSTRPSRFEAHAGIFRLLMRGIFDPYVPVTF